jgi:hypothetical protein
MGFRDFRANVLARLCLLGALIVLFAWSVVGTEWQVTPLVCAALAFLAAIELVRYVESVNRELTGFLEFVAHHDFSASFPIAEKGRVFRELESAYKVLARTFRDLNRDGPPTISTWKRWSSTSARRSCAWTTAARCSS